MNTTTLRSRLRRHGCHSPVVANLLITAGRTGDPLIHTRWMAGRIPQDHLAHTTWALRLLALGYTVEADGVIRLDTRAMGILEGCKRTKQKQHEPLTLNNR